MFALGYVLNGVYRVVRPPAQGGMALVYQVEHIQLGIHRALKVLQPKYSNDEECVARFKKEAQLMAHLRDPHIAQIHDFGITEQGLLYLVMEWLEGEDLSQLRQRQPQQPMSFVLHLCRHVGAALSASHRVGVVHRDLKPANIFLCQSEPPPRDPDTLDSIEAVSGPPPLSLSPLSSEPQCKVVDFGIAHLMGNFTGSGPSKRPHPPTRAGLMLGTPGYMAPEQILSALGPVGPYTDQFALAVIAYELLIGDRLFVPEGRDVGALYGMAQRMMVGKLPPLPPEAEEALGPALRRALHHQPEGRFPSVAQFVEALTQPPAERRTQPLPKLQPSAHTPEPAESLRMPLSTLNTAGPRTALLPWMLGAAFLTMLVLGGLRLIVSSGPRPLPRLTLRETAERKELVPRPRLPPSIPLQPAMSEPAVPLPAKILPVKNCKRHTLDIILDDDRSFGAQHHQWVTTRKGVVRKCIDDLHLRTLVYGFSELVLRRSGALIVANASFPPAKAKMLESCLENSLKPQWRPRGVRIKTITIIDPHPCSNKAK